MKYWTRGLHDLLELPLVLPSRLFHGDKSRFFHPTPPLRAIAASSLVPTSKWRSQLLSPMWPDQRLHLSQSS